MDFLAPYAPLLASAGRHLLTLGGGALVARGVADAGTVEAISGGVVALVGLVWSFAAKKDDVAARKAVRRPRKPV